MQIKSAFLTQCILLNDLNLICSIVITAWDQVIYVHVLRNSLSTSFVYSLKVSL